MCAHTHTNATHTYASNHALNTINTQAHGHMITHADTHIHTQLKLKKKCILYNKHICTVHTHTNTAPYAIKEAQTRKGGQGP